MTDIEPLRFFAETCAAISSAATWPGVREEFARFLQRVYGTVDVVVFTWQPSNLHDTATLPVFEVLLAGGEGTFLLGHEGTVHHAISAILADDRGAGNDVSPFYLSLGQAICGFSAFPAGEGAVEVVAWQESGYDVRELSPCPGLEHYYVALVTRQMDIQRRWFQKLDQVERQLYRDELTGLYNYRYLETTLEAELRRAQRFGDRFSILFIDIDDFKKINDSFGHLVGSSVLREVGDLLRDALREIDTIIRYGGDEFVVLLLGASAEMATVVAERVRSCISNASFTAVATQVIRATVSVGIAAFPEHGTDKRTLLHFADETMYTSKKRGKNCVSILPSPALAQDRSQWS